MRPRAGTLGAMGKQKPPELRARLSEEADRAWRRFVNEERVTTTAMVEAMCRELAAGRWRPTKRMIDLAHDIDWERHSR